MYRYRAEKTDGRNKKKNYDCVSSITRETRSEIVRPAFYFVQVVCFYCKFFLFLHLNAIFLKYLKGRGVALIITALNAIEKHTLLRNFLSESRDR